MKKSGGEIGTLQDLVPDTELVESKSLWENYGSCLPSSELLERFAQPLLANAPPEEDFEGIKSAIGLSVAIWNALVGADSRRAARQTFIERFRPAFDGPDAQLLEIFDSMSERKEKLFPTDERFIIDFAVEDNGWPNFYLEVLAAPPEDVAEEYREG